MLSCSLSLWLLSESKYRRAVEVRCLNGCAVLASLFLSSLSLVLVESWRAATVLMFWGFKFLWLRRFSLANRRSVEHPGC